MFDEHLTLAEACFAQNLPYWCSDFSRPTDREFAALLKGRGHSLQYLVLEMWDQVYIPASCDLNAVKATAKVRATLRSEGIAEELLPLLV
ncbi:hypothetical protein [Pseudomonas sp. GV071]|jgi:hypothetical protein|uniref:hypothetical protein n=1 Tax=Pseudomonas sp. GV071 TaxID=2135754 RepID=UPI000D49D09C|nr:hypothetical protein [Pseudomonas sp. GV071]PTQ74156.1 hypothetical protein C8K61_101596 [Pseudomonas sp. GV071]